MIKQDILTMAIANLQQKVNEISDSLEGIDTLEKLEQAQEMARQDEEVQGLLLDILDEALSNKWISDTKETIRKCNPSQVKIIKFSKFWSKIWKRLQEQI